MRKSSLILSFLLQPEGRVGNNSLDWKHVKDVKDSSFRIGAEDRLMYPPTWSKDQVGRALLLVG